jgi:transposase
MGQIGVIEEWRISGSSQPHGVKMKQKSGPSKPPAETVVKHIRRRTRKQHSTEETIRIVLEGLPARSLENHDIRRRRGAA